MKLDTIKKLESEATHLSTGDDALSPIESTRTLKSENIESDYIEDIDSDGPSSGIDDSVKDLYGGVKNSHLLEDVMPKVVAGLAILVGVMGIILIFKRKK